VRRSLGASVYRTERKDPLSLLRVHVLTPRMTHRGLWISLRASAALGGQFNSGHARPSTTLDHYLGRRAVTTADFATALRVLAEPG
jgi:hypothetical protein